MKNTSLLVRLLIVNFVCFAIVLILTGWPLVKSHYCYTIPAAGLLYLFLIGIKKTRNYTSITFLSFLIPAIIGVVFIGLFFYTESARPGWSVDSLLYALVSQLLVVLMTPFMRSNALIFSDDNNTDLDVVTGIIGATFFTAIFFAVDHNSVNVYSGLMLFSVMGHIAIVSYFVLYYGFKYALKPSYRWLFQ